VPRPVLVEELLDDAQVLANDLVVGSTTPAGYDWSDRRSGWLTPARVRSASPVLGADTGISASYARGGDRGPRATDHARKEDGECVLRGR
jgi:hypothetical protein